MYSVLFFFFHLAKGLRKALSGMLSWLRIRLALYESFNMHTRGMKATQAYKDPQDPTEELVNLDQL